MSSFPEFESEAFKSDEEVIEVNVDEVFLKDFKSDTGDSTGFKFVADVTGDSVLLLLSREKLVTTESDLGMYKSALFLDVAVTG